MLRLSLKHHLLGAVLLFTTLSASADTISQTVQFGPFTSDAAMGAGNPLTIQFFNSNLGTLNSVSFTSSYQISSQIVMVASSPSTGTVRTQSGAQFASTDSAVTSVLNTAVNKTVDPVDGRTVRFGTASLSPIAYDLRGNTSNYNLGAGSSAQYVSSASGTTPTITDTSAADLAAFFRPGGGAYSILLNTLSGLIVSQAGGNAFGSQLTTASASLNVTYNYTAAAPPPVAVTPEPSSLALFATGLLGAVGVTRRRYQ